MKKQFCILILFTLFISIKSESADDQDFRIKDLIKKSKDTRQQVTDRNNRNPRDPASTDTSLKEFELLMNSENDKDWLKEVDKLTE